MNAAATDVIVVGAGVTGIGAGYYLGSAGIPYTILEASADLGGVWSTHRWHGARCDSDVVKYSFSFKPLVTPRCLERSDTLHAYLRSVAAEFGILERIRFDSPVSKAVFDTDAKRWTVETSRGTFTARFLLNGNGYFGEPYVPKFEGSADFGGEIVHTSALDGSRTFTGRDVVVVGSGSTAICCAPELVPISRSVTLIQRSPSYIYETSNVTGPLERFCARAHARGVRLPLRLLRCYLQARDDAIFVGCRYFPRAARWFFKRHWAGAVGEDALERHFRPRYNPWQQRVAVAIGLKDLLRTHRLAIKTAEIDRFTKSGIVLGTGEEVPCDVCILATGFDLSFVKFDLYVGADKVAPDGIDCYKGVMFGAVPNYFQPFGVWHSAWTQRSEMATTFAIKIMTYMARHGYRAVSVDRRDVPLVARITPNYVKRSLAAIPHFYGTYELPTVDNLVSFRFRPRQLRFS
jgi:cation diffusion facilitator CzcD-associated flavoprotein CzcO